MKCCLIIVTFNGSKWIKECIHSILKGLVVPDIYVVDNGSTDATLDILRHFPQVNILENNKNLGFGKANNLALLHAYQKGYTHFILLNQDTEIFEDSIQNLLEATQESDGFGVLSPIHLDEEGKLEYGFQRHLKLRGGKEFLKDYLNHKLKRGIYKAGFVNAAAWLITRECLKKIGVFHPLFPQYGEDDNLIHRLNYFGLRLGVVPSSRIIHKRDSRVGNRQGIGLDRSLEKMLLLILLNPNYSGFKKMVELIYQSFLHRQMGFRKIYNQYKEVRNKVSSYNRWNYNPLNK